MSQTDSNPYESPRDSNLPANEFADRGEADVAELRRRVLELERRVGHSWHVHPSLLLRIFAVWGYLLLGYVMIVVVALSFMAVFWLITGHWPS